MADLPARPSLDHLRREARTTELDRQAEAFCEASIRDWTGRAARMLAANPELAGYNFATAVILGDADRVRAEIARNPGRGADRRRGDGPRIGHQPDARARLPGRRPRWRRRRNGAARRCLLRQRGRRPAAARPRREPPGPRRHLGQPSAGWAAVGSGERPATNPRPDWIATVAALLDAGASTEGITLSPDEPKQPSPEVAALLQQAIGQAWP